jgi:predicted NBD/HSP70 family sugar kinase
MDRASLAGVLDLPKSTVVGVVDDLIARGLVREVPARAAGRVGRPAKLLRLVGPRRVIGVAVLSLGRLRVAIADVQGEILASDVSGMEQVDTASGIVDPALVGFDALLTGAKLERSNLNGVVLGVPAPFQRGRGRPRGRSEEALDGWANWLDHDPSGEVTARLRLPCMTENDANLGALGEGAFGAGRGLDSFVYVKIGTGAVGAGIVLHGQLHRGVAGFAGELAHVQVQEGGSLCRCGGRGCLIGLLDATLMQTSHASYEDPPPLHELLRFAESGAPGPRRILADLGQTLGRSLAGLTTLLNPAAIIIDGSLGAAGAEVVAGVRQAIDRHAAPVAADSITVLLGELGDTADLLGGIVLARDELLTGIDV